MYTAANIFLLIAGLLLLFDVYLIVTKRPNPIKGWPLPCPITLVCLGIGLILSSIASF